MKNMEQGVPVPDHTETREATTVPVTGTHTPGPWTVMPYEFDPFETGAFHIAGPEWVCIAYRPRWPAMAKESLANARLIAAAPALLAACKLIAAYAVAGEPLSVGDIRDVTAAIARAEGR